MTKLLQKLDLSRIISDEIVSLHGSSYSRNSSLDLALFFIIPLAVSSVLVWQKVYLNQDLRGLLINLFAIFAGLLFGLQVFVFDIVSRTRETATTAQAAKVRILKIKYLSNNVSFEILICLLGSVALLFSSAFTSPSISLISQAFSLTIFYLFILFVLLLILILKAVHILLSEEIAFQEEKIDRFL